MEILFGGAPGAADLVLPGLPSPPFSCQSGQQDPAQRLLRDGDVVPGPVAPLLNNPIPIFSEVHMSLMLRRFAPSNDVLGVHRLNALLDDAFSGWPGNGVATSVWVPAVDVFEDKESLKDRGRVACLKPEDVKITMENNTLTLRARRSRLPRRRMSGYIAMSGAMAASSGRSPSQHRGRRQGGRLVRERCADNHPAQGREGKAAGDRGGGEDSQPSAVSCS
jgi:hypothetical protein